MKQRSTFSVPTSKGSSCEEMREDSNLPSSSILSKVLSFFSF